MFEFLLADQPPLMAPAVVASAIGWSRRTVYELCEINPTTTEPPPLEAHVIPGRGRKRKHITRRSVAAFLLRSATYDPRDFPTLLRLTLPTMTPAQLRQLAKCVAAEIEKQTTHKAKAPRTAAATYPNQ